MSQSIYLVVGLGKTGHSIASYLQRRQLPFIFYDTRKEVGNLDEFIHHFPGVEVFLEDLPASVYPQLKEIIASPGVALDIPVFMEARRLGIPIIGDIECFAREVSAPVIAITGTNGKSTVTTLVGEMARAAGLKVAVAGNIGLPVLDLLDNDEQYDLWVLELSSFQLDLLFSLAPVAATILNISPDHLDRHFTLNAYIAAKQRIYLRSKVNIYNRDDKQTYPLEAARDAKLISYGLDAPEAENWGIIQKDSTYFLAQGNKPILAVDLLRLKGKHNWQNALAACALASTAGIKIDAMVAILKSFSGLTHRCQWVRTLNGVDWINDSKGTNIGATISAVLGIGGAMQGKIVLIAGGLGKGADFSELKPALNQFVRAVILIGADAHKIEQAIKGSVSSLHATSLEEAIDIASLQAKPGDIVLLSPACASQDMFRDFNHRGEVFMNLVGNL
ncbi:UDP-N-acetylmuramoylalanine--D-glutamate ligase [Legionella beliardensis]|uniref:UDP-N-acetylmuramoylalanine--D-glutamate ligase n=1 Tax=Legionella beliardensis TaxID=91822 RepID=A0A378I4R4_9GAMM|nr:UDP-N-acetylmuramoyl-L-alanine--D-glutamate ligase [Legionella beliardensis]STX30003.1 UDP-N-acetylmuramoylalanine--D-glutamate ligase [Legionella beliardensis]